MSEGQYLLAIEVQVQFGDNKGLNTENNASIPEDEADEAGEDGEVGPYSPQDAWEVARSGDEEAYGCQSPVWSLCQLHFLDRDLG